MCLMKSIILLVCSADETVWSFCIDVLYHIYISEGSLNNKSCSSSCIDISRSKEFEQKTEHYPHCAFSGEDFIAGLLDSTALYACNFI